MTKRLTLGCVIVLALTLQSGSVRAQEPETASISIEDVQTQIAKISDSSDIEATAKENILSQYQQAAEELTASERWLSRTAEYQAALDAPERVDEIRQTIETSRDQAYPLPDASASLLDLEQSLNQYLAGMDEVRARRSLYEVQMSGRSERRTLIPQRIAVAQERLLKLEQETPVSSPDDPAELLESRRVKLQVSLQSTRNQIQAYRLETNSFDVRGRVASAEVDLATQEISRLDTAIGLIRERVKNAREQEAEVASEELNEVRELLLNVDSTFKESADLLIQEIEQLIGKRTGPEGLVELANAASAALQSTVSQNEQLELDQEQVRQRINAGGVNQAVSLVLRNYRSTLPSVRQQRRSLRKHQQELSNLQYQQINMEQDRRALQATFQGASVEDISSGDLPVDIVEANRAIIRQLEDIKRTELDKNLELNAQFLDAKVALVVAEEQLLIHTKEFSGFIAENILWMRSHERIQLSDLVNIKAPLQWLIDAENWKEAGNSIWTHSKSLPSTSIFYISTAVLLIGMRPGLKKRIVRQSVLARARSNTSFSPTAWAFLYSVIRAMSLAGIFFVAALLLQSYDTSSHFTHSLDLACVSAGILAFYFSFLYEIMKSDGLGQSHFGWRQTPVDTIRKQLPFAGCIFLLSIIPVVMINNSIQESWVGSLGRILTTLLLLEFSVLIYLVTNTKKGYYLQLRGLDTPARPALYYAIGFFLIVSPIVFIALGLFGYVYTSMHFARQFITMMAVLTVVIIMREMALRWLLLMRRRITKDEWKRKRDALKEAESEIEEKEVLEDKLDVAKLTSESTRTVNNLTVLFILLGFWSISSDLIPALSILTDYELWDVSKTVSVTDFDPDMPDVEREVLQEVLAPITVGSLLLALIVGLLSFVASRNVPGQLDVFVLRRLNISPGRRYAFTTVLTYLIATAGGLVAFNIIGFDWSKLQWLVAALGVGIGFGLQEIVANFISGLIILFEQPIRVGDTVTVGGVSGEVSRIRIRATTITDWNKKELIVPNKEFVTGQIVNWSLTQPSVRLVIPVGIAYGSDTEKAIKIMLETTKNVQNVLKEPASKVLFVGFGASSLDFEIRAFSPDVDSFVQIRHDVLLSVDKAFREADIVIAFPQLDIHTQPIHDTQMDLDTSASDNE